MKKAILIISMLSISGLASAKFVSIVDKKSNNYNVGEELQPPKNPVYILERKQTLNGGYTVWSDGYKEAWGQYHKGSNLYNNETIIINLPFTFDQPSKAFAKANLIGRQGNGDAGMTVIEINSNNIGYGPDGSHSGTLFAQSFMWVAQGY